MGSNTSGRQEPKGTSGPRSLFLYAGVVCIYGRRGRNDWVLNKKCIGEQEVLGQVLVNEFQFATAKAHMEPSQSGSQS